MYSICIITLLRYIILYFITDKEEEVTADHPEVRQMVDEAMKIAHETPVTLNADVYVSVLEKAITEVYG